MLLIRQAFEITGQPK